MKRALIFLIAILVCILSISTTKAFFGCAPTQDPNKYAHIWKDSTGNFHLSLCFTPRDNVQTYLNNYGLTYDKGELRGAFNVKYNQSQQKYEAYVGQTPLNNVIASLQYAFIESRDITQGERIANMLDNLALLMVEDRQAQINYLSTNIFLDREGILSGGKISVPRTSEGKDNIMFAGSIISTYYFKGLRRPYTQPELQISGISLEFTRADERKLTWNEANAYLLKSDRSEKQSLSRYTADIGTVVRYISKDKMLKVEKGRLYKDDEEIKNAIVKLVTEDKTLICCSRNPEYCVIAENKLYPLAALSIDCNFGIGNLDIKHDKTKKETTIKGTNVKIIYSPDINRILALVRGEA